MASIFFGNKIDMITSATPSSGSYLIAYDLDGVLKQKDEFGIIYPIILNITGGSGLTFSGNDLMVELDPNYLEFIDNKIKLKESIIGEIDFFNEIIFSGGLTSSDGYFTKLRVTDEPIIGADVINLDYFGLSFSELLSNITNQINTLDSNVIKSIISDSSLDISGTSGTVSISISESSAGDGLSFSNSKYDVLLNTDGLSFDLDNSIKLNDIIIGDKQFIDSITINGNLTVSGTTTYINTEQLEISDNIITLNSGFTGSPFLDAGIKIERGDEDYARLIWNEVSDAWTVGLSGSESEIITEAGDGLLKNVNELSLDYNIFGSGLSHSSGGVFLIPQSLESVLIEGNTTGNNDIVVNGGLITVHNYSNTGSYISLLETNNTSEASGLYVDSNNGTYLYTNGGELGLFSQLSNITLSSLGINIETDGIDGTPITYNAKDHIFLTQGGGKVFTPTIVIDNASRLENESGTSFLNLRVGNDSKIILGNVNGAQLIFDEYAPSPYVYFGVDGEGYSKPYFYTEDSYGQLAMASPFGYMGFNLHSNDNINYDYSGISIKDNTTNQLITSNLYDNPAIIIGSRNSVINSGIVNSVIIGGSGITATQSNTVYVPDLVIQNDKTINAASGGGQLDLRAFNTNNTILLSTDGPDYNESSLYLDSTTNILKSGGSTNIYGPGNVVLSSGVQQNTESDLAIYVANSSTRKLTIGCGEDLTFLLGPLQNVDTIQISNTDDLTSNNPKDPTIISSENSGFLVGVVNSVITSGNNIIGSESNTLYTNNFNSFGFSKFSNEPNNTVVEIEGSTDANIPIFNINGSQGQLFSVTDNLTGKIFSVNDISGLPIIEVFSDNKVLMGNYMSPLLNTTEINVLPDTSEIIYVQPIENYDMMVLEYVLKNNSDMKTGYIQVVWNSVAIEFENEEKNTLGNPSANFPTFDFNINIDNEIEVIINSIETGWTVKTNIRVL